MGRRPFASATTVAVSVGGLASNAAAFTLEAPLVASTVTLKLGDRDVGIPKLGRRVTTKCTGTSSGIAGESCRITLQKNNGYQWIKVTGVAWTTATTVQHAAAGAMTVTVTAAGPTSSDVAFTADALPR